VSADIVPPRSIAESLIEALSDVEVDGRPVLIARAREARDVLPEALAERGAKVDVVALYETVQEESDPALVEAAREADYVTFTSSSTVRNFLAAVGQSFPGDVRVVSIGPVTSATARELGLEVAVEAERHDPEGLLEALLADAAGGS
jgi:uroporphyrinogen III methyltransferase/synthase